jgi:predicted ATPase/DNA-binding SARP family transcriptional activator
MHYGILGPFEVADDQGRELPLGGRKPRSVLAILLLRRREAVASERLIDELWGESPPASAAKTLQVYVSSLRKALGDGVLLTRAGGYMLMTEPGSVDVDRFDSLVHEGRRTLEAGDPRHAGAMLREALGLWRGPAMADFRYDAFAQGEIARLEEAWFAALEERIEADLASGETGGLVGELEALVREHPLRERLSGQLMRVLYRSGRQADALQTYRAARARLVAELGLEPGPELRRLEQAILVQDPALAIVSGEEARGRKQKPAHNLPPELTSLIGRERELPELAGLLSEHRLVTICGPGGVGKTRISQRVAIAVLDRFEDGSWFVDLAAIDRPGDVGLAVMSSVGVAIHDRIGSEVLETIATDLRERTLLIVLDNCEHVLSGAAGVAGRLLAECPGVRILATSREPLAVGGERVQRLEPLSTAAGNSDEPPPAVSLFLERAAMLGVHWAPETSGGVLDVIAELCRRLDGLPLAIELAAARSAGLSPAELLARLDARLRLLARPRDWSASARQQTLEATIAWSYDLLKEHERATLRRLAVFRGGFTLDAACAACADIGDELETIERVALLVERSVLSIEHRGVRYRLLESIGLFAEQHLQGHGEAAGARDRHAGFLLELARHAQEQLDGPEHAVWSERLDDEDDNFAAALGWCLDGGGNRVAGAELAVLLADHLRRRGRHNVARRWLERALEVTERAPVVRARVLLGLSGIGYSMDDASGMAHADEALMLARGCEDPQLLAEALTRCVLIELMRDDVGAASAASAELRALAPRLSSPRIQERALRASALNALRSGDPVQAVLDAQRGRAIARDAGNRLGAALIGCWMAYALALSEQLPAAREAIGEATRDALASGYEAAIADVASVGADLAIAGTDLPTAARLLARAAGMYLEQERLSDFGRALQAAALVGLKRGRAEQAAVLLGAATRWIGPQVSFRGELLPELASLAGDLQRRLGPDAFAELRDQGMMLEPDQAVRLLA